VWRDVPPTGFEPVFQP